MSIAKEQLRIIFMGTPEFAVHILDGLVQQNYNVVGVITAPDRPAGRGQKVKQSAVKVYAQNHQLNVLQPDNLKHPDFIATLEALDPDLQVVVAFRMLPQAVWQLPKFGTFNLHASLLPQYRGAAPINWAIINGEKETGVSTFFIDEKIDTGAIIFQKSVPILDNDTAGVLHDKLINEGKLLTLKTVDAICNNTIKTIQQPQSIELKTAHKLNKENCKIDWQKSGEDIQNLVRGLNPYPGAWAELDNGTKTYNVKIYKVQFEKSNHKKPVGTLIVEKSSINVCINDGYINVIDFKFPGKKQMDVKSFLNGFSFEKDAKMI
ncbi:MAG: methionyl-tRNA formyltransferase [Bacteroidetes bacterium]|nr:methionyl-tRNA formyltransferase [Bacteroidota bacterium]MDA0859402.1 methionyl-tRNA formyltransferase [Bacteroidota bacterium]MDA1318011.1 methionyl-tRNA formyltransferase [Bacteroidota bacterium]